MSDRNKEEEIDLIDFFRLLKNELIGLINFLIVVSGRLFFFFKNKFLYLTIAAVAGFILGWLSYFVFPNPYEAKLVLESRADNIDVLYREIEYTNKLIKDDIAFSKLENLGVDKQMINSIKAFDVKPLDNKDEKRKLYNNYIELNRKDSSVALLSYENYIKQLNSYSYPKHELTVFSFKDADFSNLLRNILNHSLKSKEVEERRLEKVKFKKRILLKLDNEIEEINLITKSIHEEFKNQPQTKSLWDLSEELLLITSDKTSLVKKQFIILEELNDLSNAYLILDDYSKFTSKQRQYRIWIGALLGFILCFLVLIFINLNVYYSKKLKK